MSRYYKDEEGVVYLEESESPSAAYSVEEWIIEKERLMVGLQKQIDGIQSQIDNQPQLIEILEDYSQEVKDLIEQHNNEIQSIEDLETKKQEKIDFKNHIEEL